MSLSHLPLIPLKNNINQAGSRNGLIGSRGNLNFYENEKNNFDDSALYELFLLFR